MKRNWDLIRLMLLGIEDHTLHKIKDYNAAEILIHFFLLERAGFVENSRVRGITLTAKGEQLTETLRDPIAYQKAMEIIDANGGGATEEVLVKLIERLRADQDADSA